MQPHDVQLLIHILDYCNDIEQYLTAVDHSRERFMDDTMAQHSVAFCILQIGELVGKLSADLRAVTSSRVNWSAIKGMRNIVVHDYGNIDLEVVWITSIDDIPVLKSLCSELLTED